MSTRLQLLLLEDSAADAELIQLTLKRGGLEFEAMVASDEDEFHDALQQKKFHAVLADNALPQYSSIEALELVRATNPHVAFILVTGTVSEEFAVTIIKEGADDYILKTNLTRLTSAVTGAVLKKEVQRQKEVAEKETGRAKEFSLAIINSLPGIFFLCDEKGSMLQWNKNFEQVGGYSRAQIETAVVFDFFQPADRNNIERYLQSGFINKHAATEATLLTTQQKTICYYFTSLAIQFGETDGLINVGIDITASKQAQKDLQVLNHDLHRISAHLENLKEQEQARIAREVHDQLGQLLTGIKMDMHWLKNNIASNYDAAALTEKVNTMMQLLDEAVHTVRKVASDLRPPILDDYGLADALEWQGIEFEKRSGIAVYFNPPNQTMQLNNNISTGIYRIYQEILTNIARHAAASNIKTSLQINTGELLLAVSDDGKGFDTSKPVTSLGLLGMKERCYMIGGIMDIRSVIGAGTTVLVKVPVMDETPEK